MALFKERLRQLRKEHNLTQKQLAVEIGASERGIQHYELGERGPTHEAILKFSRFFHVSADWLLGISDDKTIHSPIPPEGDA
jgi:transcriptional regulator with XRE-family HTH domain